MHFAPGMESSILSFVADTCLLAMVAYLLVRGPMLTLLFSDDLTLAQSLKLGGAMGLIGLLEAFFPDAQFPYPTHTLFVTFAAIAGGLRVGLITALIVGIGASILLPPVLVIGTIVAVVIIAVLGKVVRHIGGLRERLVLGFLLGVLAQAIRLTVHGLLLGWSHPAVAHQWISLPINGFGVALLLLVVSDAQIRAESEHRRIEAERARNLASEAQLATLRARVHPHFLFNALGTVAELCHISPDRAESAVLSLSDLMRRALASGGETQVSLQSELDSVQTYLRIEQERFGKHLRVAWNVDAAPDGTLVPPFSVQTLVENAITHAVSQTTRPSCVAIRVRRSAKHTLIAVRDDGPGMPAEERRRAIALSEPAHGLALLQQQLLLLYGKASGLRLFCAPGGGTLAAFAVPTGRSSAPGEDIDR